MANLEGSFSLIVETMLQGLEKVLLYEFCAFVYNYLRAAQRFIEVEQNSVLAKSNTFACLQPDPGLI